MSADRRESGDSYRLPFADHAARAQRAQLRECQVARLILPPSARTRTVSAVAHLIEVDGVVHLVMDLVDAPISDRDAPSYRFR